MDIQPRPAVNNNDNNINDNVNVGGGACRVVFNNGTQITLRQCNCTEQEQIAVTHREFQTYHCKVGRQTGLIVDIW